MTGSQLAEARKTLGYSAATMAEKIGMSERHYWRLEAKKHMVIPRIYALAVERVKETTHAR